MIRWIAFLVLAGCGLPGGIPNPSARPVVRSYGGASASLTIIACPPNEARAAIAGELLQFLVQHEELVVAYDGGNSRLIINACPVGTLETPRGTATRR
jgi:hypothetical protein